MWAGGSGWAFISTGRQGQSRLEGGGGCRLILSRLCVDYGAGGRLLDWIGLCLDWMALNIRWDFRMKSFLPKPSCHLNHHRYGSHLGLDSVGIVEPGQGFGTGHHASVDKVELEGAHAEHPLDELAAVGEVADVLVVQRLDGLDAPEPLAHVVQGCLGRRVALGRVPAYAYQRHWVQLEHDLNGGFAR